MFYRCFLFIFDFVFSEETQVTLLRNAWVEIFALGLAQCAQTLSIPTIMSSLVNYVKTVISQEKVPPNGVKKIVEHVWKLQEFVCGMNRLELDDCEYAYLKLISLFNAGQSYYSKSKQCRTTTITNQIYFPFRRQCGSTSKSTSKNRKNSGAGCSFFEIIYKSKYVPSR